MLGATVHETTPEETPVYLGKVTDVYWKTWGSKRSSARPHSLRLDHLTQLHRRSVRTVLVWSGGRWRNMLHKRARYTVVPLSSNSSLGT